MKIGLQFPERLSGALNVVKEEFEHLIAGIHGGWFVQHKTDGSHQSLTTDTAAVDTKLFVGPVTANARITAGITVKQGGTINDALLTLQAPITHTWTNQDPQTFGVLRAATTTLNGGLSIQGISVTGTTTGIQIHGQVADVDTAARSTSSGGPVLLQGGLISSGTPASLGGNANVVVVRDNGTTRFVLDSDGDSHQDVGTAWTNFDDQDDLLLMESLATTMARPGDPLREAFVQDLEQHRARLETLPGKPLVTFNEDGHHFVNMSRLIMLQTGAIRQLGRMVQSLHRQLEVTNRDSA